MVFGGLLELVVSGVVTGLGAVVTAAVQQRSVQAARREALAHVASLAERAVLEQLQTRIKPARKSDADGSPVGRISPATAEAAKAAAVALVAELAGAAAAKALGGADALLRLAAAEVEAAVARAKAKPATLAQAAEAAKAL